MADKSSQLLLTGLTRAAADTAGVSLHGNETAPGLFPTTTLGKQAAQRCLDEGYLFCLPDDRALPPGDASRTRTATVPICTITDKGLDFLLSQVSPRQVLEDFVRVLESREKQVGQLIALARQMQSSLELLRAGIAPVLAEVARNPGLPKTTPEPGHHATTNGDLKGLFHEFRQDKPTETSEELKGILMSHLERWSCSGALEDCPLPELFRQARGADSDLSIGRFHDNLRHLEEAGQIHLHPWTGPLYGIPEPPYALLVGHAVAYYASLRKEE